MLIAFTGRVFTRGSKVDPAVPSRLWPCNMAQLLLKMRLVRSGIAGTIVCCCGLQLSRTCFSLSLLKTFELQIFKNGLFAMSYWSEALRALLSERNDLRIRGGPEFEVAHLCPSQSKVAMPKSRCAWMLWFDKLRWPTMQDEKKNARVKRQCKPLNKATIEIFRWILSTGNRWIEIDSLKSAS